MLGLSDNVWNHLIDQRQGRGVQLSKRGDLTITPTLCIDCPAAMEPGDGYWSIFLYHLWMCQFDAGNVFVSSWIDLCFFFVLCFSSTSRLFYEFSPLIRYSLNWTFFSNHNSTLSKNIFYTLPSSRLFLVSYIICGVTFYQIHELQGRWLKTPYTLKRCVCYILQCSLSLQLFFAVCIMAVGAVIGIIPYLH